MLPFLSSVRSLEEARMKTIAAISTPPAAGGIAMIRMSGEDAIAISEHMFRSTDGRKPSQMRGYSCAYGVISDGEERLDDVILTVFRAPHSYTGEDTVEITCHGGIYVTKRILGLLFRSGASPASPGEFTKRAFLNGKLSLSQAEAVMDVIQADGAAALQQANYAREGRLGRQMREISSQITELLSALAYWLDDAEEEPPELERDTLTAQITEISARIHEIAAHYEDGRLIREGIRTVLLGLPNAGKSTVMNWLCGSNRSIVTEIAGTTRDVVTEQVKIAEYTLLLSDTAGIRETDNPIETIGIAQAYRALDEADLVLYTVDSTKGITGEDRQMLEKCAGKRVLILWNKSDLPHEMPADPPHLTVECAAVHEPSLHDFETALRDMLGSSAGDTQLVALNERQQHLLCCASERIDTAISLLQSCAPPDLLYAELETAANYLMEIEGERVTEDVIDGVFSRFCVGK